MDGGEVDAAKQSYVSRFSSWDQQSWIRAKPHRIEPFQTGKKFFSADHCTLLSVPAIADATNAVREAILIHALYQHLSFTVALETGPINEACVILNEGTVFRWLPEAMRLDALRIYADEGGHAEMTYALMASVQEHTGVRPIRHTPRFLRDLDGLVQRCPDQSKPLVKICFSVVSETSITSTLRHVPGDEGVQPSVRAVLADHASDEGRHHAYFHQLFEMMWPRFSKSQRRMLGPLFPRMIYAFFQPDEELHAKTLQSVGYSAEMAATAARYATKAWLDSHRVQDDASRTLQMFSDAGMREDPDTVAAFDRLSLTL
jgi:P-aminobenzoate N-oxygenase AurF